MEQLRLQEMFFKKLDKDLEQVFQAFLKQLFENEIIDQIKDVFMVKKKEFFYEELSLFIESNFILGHQDINDFIREIIKNSEIKDLI